MGQVLHCDVCFTDEQDGSFKVDAEPCMTTWASLLNEVQCPYIIMLSVVFCRPKKQL